MKRYSAAVLMIGLLFMIATVAGAQSNAQGAPVEQGSRTYQLSITSNVRNADVYVDGVRQREETPTTIRLRPGTYEIRVVARGYSDFVDRVSVYRNTAVHAELVPPYAKVRLYVPDSIVNDSIWNPWRFIHFFVDGRRYLDEWVEVLPGWREFTIESGGLRFESEFYLEPGMEYDLELMMQMELFDGGRRRPLLTQPYRW